MSSEISPAHLPHCRGRGAVLQNILSAYFFKSTHEKRPSSEEKFNILNSFLAHFLSTPDPIFRPLNFGAREHEKGRGIKLDGDLFSIVRLIFCDILGLHRSEKREISESTWEMCVKIATRDGPRFCLPLHVAGQVVCVCVHSLFSCRWCTCMSVRRYVSCSLYETHYIACCDRSHQLVVDGSNFFFKFIYGLITRFCFSFKCRKIVL